MGVIHISYCMDFRCDSGIQLQRKGTAYQKLDKQEVIMVLCMQHCPHPKSKNVNTSYFPKYVGFPSRLTPGSALGEEQLCSWALPILGADGRPHQLLSRSRPTKGLRQGNPSVKLHAWQLTLWFKVFVPCYNIPRSVNIFFSVTVLSITSFSESKSWWWGWSIISRALLSLHSCSPWPSTCSRTHLPVLHWTLSSQLASDSFIFVSPRSIKELSFILQELLFLALVQFLVHLLPSFKTFSGIIEWTQLAVFHTISEYCIKSGLPKV